MEEGIDLLFLRLQEGISDGELYLLGAGCAAWNDDFGCRNRDPYGAERQEGPAY